MTKEDLEKIESNLTCGVEFDYAEAVEELADVVIYNRLQSYELRKKAAYAILLCMQNSDLANPEVACLTAFAMASAKDIFLTIQHEAGDHTEVLSDAIVFLLESQREFVDEDILFSNLLAKCRTRCGVQARMLPDAYRSNQHVNAREAIYMEYVARMQSSINYAYQQFHIL